MKLIEYYNLFNIIVIQYYNLFKLIQYYNTFTYMNNDRKKEKISDKSSVGSFFKYYILSLLKV